MIKKLHALAVFILAMNICTATPIDQSIAKKVAKGFLKQSVDTETGDLSLMYTASLPNGTPAYYVFTMSSNTGFIIIAADNAAHPVIGYSTENSFAVPTKNSTLGYWLQKRINEVDFIQSHNIKASEEITGEWEKLSGNGSLKKTAASSSVNAVTPLVHTLWNQSPYYNDMCPSGSVTGCVATTMAQIMRYWNYPATGMGSSTYCDCTSNGKTNNFGNLSANYGATTYNWANMPLSISGPNADIAQLMYHCGVSVEMDYDPSGSGAWVITAEDPICAQNAYVAYFGYDPTTIKGLQRGYYSDNAWIQVLKNDLNIGWPVQYVGYDATQGGHTWVCDGYDQTNKVHMNWGWGGYGNGYFTVDNLNVGGYNPVEYEEALTGITPPTIGNDAGITSILSPAGSSCASSAIPEITLRNYGTTPLTSCTINYQLDNGSLQTQAWSGSLGTFQSVNVSLSSITLSAGTHNLVCYTSNPNSTTDIKSSNDQATTVFNVGSTGHALPVMEGFESTSVLPAAWAIGNPDNDATWQIVTDVARTGNKCIGMNNCYGTGDNSNLTGKKDYFYTNSYDFSSSTPQMMTFDVASATYFDGGSTTLQDTLVVHYSTDCGLTWHQIYKKSNDLPTASNLFIPTATQYCWQPADQYEWRLEVIDLSSIAGSPNVIFAFENISSSAEWLFIDNINIAVNSVGIKTFDADNDLVSVYPNPAKESLTIKGTGTNGAVSFSIYNTSGQLIKTEDMSSGTAGFSKTIALNEMANGIYIIKVRDEKKVWVKKFTIQ